MEVPNQATVLNTSNIAVVWKVNGVVGGNATLGTISTAGLYTAPASLAATTTVTVAAVSQANTAKSATAQVTVTPAAVKPITITVTPTTASLSTGATQQFSVAVLNTANTAVVWKVSTIPRDSTYLFTMRYEVPDSDIVRLMAKVRGDSLYVELVRTNRQFQLAERQFHWISEYNR